MHSWDKRWIRWTLVPSWPFRRHLSRPLLLPFWLRFHQGCFLCPRCVVCIGSMQVLHVFGNLYTGVFVNKCVEALGWRHKSCFVNFLYSHQGRVSQSKHTSQIHLVLLAGLLTVGCHDHLVLHSLCEFWGPEFQSSGVCGKSLSHPWSLVFPSLRQDTQC